MGTPDFSVPVLQGLIDHPDYHVSCVYTQPPRPAGRGHKITPSPVHHCANTHGIEVRHPLSLKEESEQHAFHDLQADIAIVVAYGLLLPKPILDAPDHGCVNIHASLLPRWRGAAPIQRAIEAGDTTTGITLMRMDEGLDTGPMFIKETTPIRPETTAQSLHDTLSKQGADLLMGNLKTYLEGNLKPTAQPETGISYAQKITKEEGCLDWKQSAQTLFHKMRALSPWPGVWFEYRGERLKVHDAEIQEGRDHALGQTVNSNLHIACKEGIFCPTVVQKQGGKPMPVEDFLRGYPIPEGTLLL